ncbi:MAG: deoxyribonuclease V [Chthonomonadales bacterium]
MEALAATTAEAMALQAELRDRVRIEPLPLASVQLVAGVDTSSEWHSSILHAAVVVMRWADGVVVEQGTASGCAPFPYVPGLLSFRELPILTEARSRLTRRPDIVLCDGHGLAHPRSFGLACHLGVLWDVPSVGCAKSVLVGDYAAPGPNPGDWSPLTLRGIVVGAALRTRRGVAPVFVSPGHRINLEGAIEVVLRCISGARLPEPIRAAHRLANEVRRSARVASGSS